MLGVVWMETWTLNGYRDAFKIFIQQVCPDSLRLRPPGWRFSGREHTIPILRESNEVEEIRLPPSQSALPSSGLLGLAHWIVNICACAPPYSGAPTRRQILSPLKNQRDEEQRQPGTMRSRLPRTACLLRLVALCILLAHSAAYFGSVDFLIT